MRWRVLWQPGPLDQGAEVLWQPDVLANFFHRSVTDSLGDCPFPYLKKKQNLEVKKKCSMHVLSHLKMIIEQRLLL